MKPLQIKTVAKRSNSRQNLFFIFIVKIELFLETNCNFHLVGDWKKTLQSRLWFIIMIFFKKKPFLQKSSEKLNDLRDSISREAEKRQNTT